MSNIRSRRRQLLLPAAAAALLSVALTGSGSFAGTVQPKDASCTPDGTALQLKAFDQKFDKNCLAAPATQDFTIEFSNLDRGIPHNVAIYEDETAKKNFFKGELTDGPGKQTYSVKGLPAGKWFFRCDPHPEMNGTFVSG
jgi:plastocyanin